MFCNPVLGNEVNSFSYALTFPLQMLSKFACGVNKPNKQTILPHLSVPGLFSSLPVKKM